MLNKVDYWLDLCDDDLSAAKALYASKNYLWMGFICHLITEKALKAVIANITEEVPPKIHDLDKLAVRGGISNELSDKQLKLLADLSPLHIDGRYPEYKEQVRAQLTDVVCKHLLHETEDFLCWIKTKLGKSPPTI